MAVGVLQHLSWEALRPTAAFAAAVLKHNGILIASVPTKHPGAKTSDGRWYSDLPVEGYEEVFGAVSLRTAYVSEPELEGPKETPAEWRTVVFVKDSLGSRH
ncbi:MAG: hypothetical protein Q3Y13_08730 [Sutterella sp.]|nr:hypothetical protein [Sutterella sp.]